MMSLRFGALGTMQASMMGGSTLGDLLLSAGGWVDNGELQVRIALRGIAAAEHAQQPSLGLEAERLCQRRRNAVRIQDIPENKLVWHAAEQVLNNLGSDRGTVCGHRTKVVGA